MRLAILGGGSVYVAGILRTLLARGRAAEVVLQDIDLERAELLRDVGRALAGACDAELKVDATADLDVALDGADFVIPCFRIGGFDALKLDEDIPIKHGLFGNEMEGVGGLMLGQRTVPVVADIARRMERLCPDAWMVSYANPSALVADAVRRVSSIREVSICDGFRVAQGIVAGMLDLPQDEVTVRTAGVNHCTWMLQCLHKGEDVTAAFHERVRTCDRSAVKWKWQHLFKIVDTYGRLPSPGGHMLCYFILDEVVRIQQREGFHSVYAGRETQARIREHLRAVARGDAGALDMSLEGMDHYAGSVSDVATSVVLALAQDQPREVIVNYANTGAIANLPKGAIVEGPCLVSRAGVYPMHVGDLDAPVLPLLHTLIESRRLAVDAALAGDRTKLLQAIHLDPTVADLTVARAVMDELLAAQAEWLPQYRD